MKKHWVTVLCLTFGLSLCTLVTGQVEPKDDKQKDLRKCFELMGGAEMIHGVFDALEKSMSPDKRKEWQEFRKQLRTEDLIDEMVAIYGRYLNHDEVKGIIEFYESPTGQKFVSVQPNIMQDSMAVGQRWAMEAMQRVETLASADARAKLLHTQPARMKDNGDGTATDTQTGLMWTIRDNGSDIDWNRAKSYCENLGLAGYGDWVLPDIDSLEALYDESRSFDCWHLWGTTYQCHIYSPLSLTAPFIWSSSLDGSASAWHFVFYVRQRQSPHLGNSRSKRALCVRRLRRPKPLLPHPKSVGK